MIKIRSVVALYVYLFLCSTTTTNAATIIDTTSYWNGMSGFLSFGEYSIATSGQTFLVGPDNQLDSFTFYLRAISGLDPVHFQAYVMAWDGSKATGPVLYQSSPMSTTTTGVYEAFTINTSGLNLISGNNYVAFFSASNLFNGSGFASEMGTVAPSAYSDGSWVWLNNHSDFSLITTDIWTQVNRSDIAFTMNFSSAVPIPPALYLFSSGLLGLVGMARKKVS